MKKFNIIMVLTAVVLLLVATYLNLPKSSSVDKATTVHPLNQKKNVQQAKTVSLHKRRTILKNSESSSSFKVDTNKAVAASRRDINEYQTDENADEEVYDNKTVVLSVEKDYDKFFAKTKNSIVTIKNSNTTFYGAVTKSQKGIFVITDRSTATDSTKVVIKTLDGHKLNIDTVTSCDKLVSFKLKAPFPNKLKPVDTVNYAKAKKVITLGAFSFDYGDEPEMTIGKGIVKKNGVCEISSKLRRCRPGTPLFTSKGNLYGITTWDPTGNTGTAIASRENKWSEIKYPFVVVRKKLKRNRYKSNGSRYK